MGFYDILKRKKTSKKVPQKSRGDEVVAESKEEFDDLCKSLSLDFNGMMVLHSKTEGKNYAATLLLEKGKVIGASFEELDKKRIAYKKTAIAKIKSELTSTKGNLDLYSFTKEDLTDVKKNNSKVLLSTKIPFSKFGMRIRMNLHPKKGGRDELDDESFSASNAVKVRDIKIERNFNLTAFARSLPSKTNIYEPLETKEKKGAKDPLEDEKNRRDMQLKPRLPNIRNNRLKTQRIAELKRKRQEQDQELMKRISDITKKKPEQEKKETCKVQTSIDKLYQLVQKYGKVRIDDNLVKKLGVRRSQIESWALILEEHNLVELHYPAIGEPEIRKIQ